MRSLALLVLALPLATTFTPCARAQERAAEDELVRVELRVQSASPGSPVVVDRGAADGLSVGDVVWIEPRGGARQRAVIASVEERSATIEFVDGPFRPEPGARGEVLVPAERLAPELETGGEPPEAVAPPVAIELHATSRGPGAVALVDRGSEHGLQLGDDVRFPLPGGRTARGVITQLGNATAVVTFAEGEPPSTGALGEALVPRARFAPGAEGEGAHPGWENQDEEWAPGLPLLSQAKAVRPEDRPRSLTGFTYLGGQYRFTNEDDRSDSITRLGGHVVAENPFGSGGALEFDAEFNYRTTTLPDEDDADESRVLLERLSYRHGGTRFQPSRWEVGRFLQNGMPEFGVLDGGEFIQRLPNGDRVGASAGFIADPLLTLNSGEDLQFGGFYEWNLGEEKPLSFAAGYQKSFHDNDSDRDLAVVKLRYLPPSGWDFQGTAWVDFYTESDVVKESGPELSQLWLSSRRAFANGNGLSFSYRHLRRPETLRDEFIVATAESLADARWDRLAGDTTLWLGQDTALNLEAGVWNDETESGGDASIGFELRELFWRGGRGFLTAFATKGQFSGVVGGRISYGRVLPHGQWELLYELSNQHQDGFTDERDDIVQHRVRASRDFFIGSRWSFSIYAEGVAWDESTSLALAFFLQRSF